MIALLICLLSAAHGSALDQLEVGGPWGTPVATDATAVWWNPAGLAAGQGTRIMLEGAPTLGRIHYDRDDPYGYSGKDLTKAFGVLPFAGVATDFGVPGLGFGAALVVPHARSGVLDDEIATMTDYTGPVPPEASFGRYHFREAGVQAIYGMAAASYDIQDRVAIGLGAAFVSSTWQSRIDSEVLSSLDEKIEMDVADSGYTDAMVQDPNYATTLQFTPLKDTAITFNAGVRAVIVEDMVAVGVAYTHGMRLDHTGDVTFHFGCPPQSDATGRFGAEALGICNATINGAGAVGYRLPSRVNAGVLVEPVDGLDVTVMGGWVGWSVFTDYEITIAEVEDRNPDAADPEALGEALDQERLRARDARSTGWAGVDVKGEIGEYVLLGGRVLFDQAAIPDRAVSQNNYDANTVILGALAAARPLPQLEIGLSFSAYVMPQRVITNSGWGVTVEGGPVNEDRWFYPHANGTYSGQIYRGGLQVRMHFGAEDDGEGPADDFDDDFDEPDDEIIDLDL